MDNKKLTELIKRYNAGTATSEEIALLDKFWFNANNEAALTKDHSPEELANFERDMFLAIKGEIQKQESKSQRLSIRPLLYKVAASILIVLSVSLWWYSSSNRLNEIHTAFGEHRTIILPDNSKVVLNGNSVLKYAAHWNADVPREVWIEGEGFFSVTHTSSDQKFVVHGTSQFDVEVLGTKFNIKTRDSASEVMLTEGKLKVALGGSETAREVFLKPGDLATVENKDLSTRSVRHQKYTSWMDNKLFFEHTPLRDLAVVLRDTYGLTVTFESPDLEKRELSGEISSATSDDILYAIAETLDLKVEKQGHAITILDNK
jgi:transmembrane sensor